MRGLICEVYSNPLYKKCSNGGISERCTEVTVVGEGITEIFEATPERPAVRIVRRTIGGRPYVHAEPADPVPKGNTPYVVGGSFIHSSDSRFRQNVCEYPVALHDRTETPRYCRGKIEFS
jgi:hypothetical protein